MCILTSRTFNQTEHNVSMQRSCWARLCKTPCQSLHSFVHVKILFVHACPSLSRLFPLRDQWYTTRGLLAECGMPQFSLCGSNTFRHIIFVGSLASLTSVIRTSGWDERDRSVPSQPLPGIMLQPCIREVPSSNLDTDISCPEIYRAFPQHFQANSWRVP